ncbi:hypothetical protein DFO61_2260 [Ectopseudomonas oleovorans]|uniref:Outer membrane lipoprotein SlyB n=1 Tax=Ectopseudomonas oleovorans TaxID=301 RepID=A0A397N6A0_ECTOL|nr:hypothetical protein [Pseudomonas oleovorans]RIA31538.1 hypothetical protein DFO61_2260 [Pseudomonas oleovorans]
MKPIALLVLSLGLVAINAVQAAEVVAEREENSVGAGFGGLSGLMLGAAAGGPIGALVGAVVGGWSGAQVQEASGNSGTVYVVRHDDGREQWVRSPNTRFALGQNVELQQGRLQLQ